MKRTYPAVHTADPDARVLLGGLTNYSWDNLDALYRAGAKGSFDYVAVHPFTKQVDGVVTILERVRKVMMFNGESGRHLFVTETSWPSSLNKTTRQYGFEETEQGQAKKIAAVYKLLAKERKRLKINGVYWYTWLTTDTAHVESFNYAGVVKYQHGKVTRKPAYAKLRDTAIPLEGCLAKATNAGSCSKR